MGDKELLQAIKAFHKAVDKGIALEEENSRLRGRISQLEADAQLAERAMQAALAFLSDDSSIEEWSRVNALLKSALHQ